MWSFHILRMFEWSIIGVPKCSAILNDDTSYLQFKHPLCFFLQVLLPLHGSFSAGNHVVYSFC